MTIDYQRKPKSKGTCYVDTFKYLCYESDFEDALLCHGTLKGRGKLKGYMYTHSWIEIGDVVVHPVQQKGGYSYGLAYVDRKERFYETYQIVESDIRRYRREQALQLGVRTGHFGPWHDTGLGKDGYIYTGDR